MLQISSFLSILCNCTASQNYTGKFSQIKCRVKISNANVSMQRKFSESDSIAWCLHNIFDAMSLACSGQREMKYG